MNRHSERALEGAREIANGKAALLGKVRKPKLTIEVAVDQFHHAALLPGRQAAQVDGPPGSHLPIRNSDMTTEHPHEIVEHQATSPPLVAQPWQCKPGQLKQDIVLNSLRACQFADPMEFIVVGKCVHGFARQIKMNAIEAIGTHGNRICLQIVDADAAALPATDGKELSINPRPPSVGFLLLPQMQADREPAFGSYGRCRFW